MRTSAGPVRLVLAGARGHGRWHLRNIGHLAEQGLVELAGICDLTPLEREELTGLTGLAGPGRRPPEQSGDFAALLARTGAEAAVLCTPIHTHAQLALTAAQQGVHTLLEKPPTPSYADFQRLSQGVRDAGTACQIGFQSFGSHGITAIRELLARDAIGAVRGIAAAGAWVRDDAYWQRAPWAGHRTLDGREVMDGVLTNPLAHAVATALRIAGADRAEDIAGIALELYRANPISADDTSCARIRTTAGGEVVTAVTLCAQRSAEPYVVVHGERGRITFWYKTDQVRLERAGHAPLTTSHDRTDLLRNLVAHLRDGEPLLVPPECTGGFMRLVEAIRTAPDPTELPGTAWRTDPDGPRRVIPGIAELTDESARRLALYSELGAPWAVPPVEVAPR